VSKTLRLKDGTSVEISSGKGINFSGEWSGIPACDLAEVITWYIAETGWTVLFRDGMSLEDVKEKAWNIFCQTVSSKCRNHVDAAIEYVFSCLVISPPTERTAGVRLKPGVTWKRVCGEFVCKVDDNHRVMASMPIVFSFLEADAPAAEPPKPAKVWRFNGKLHGSMTKAEDAAAERLAAGSFGETLQERDLYRLAAKHDLHKALTLLAVKHGDSWLITEEEIVQ